MDDTINGWKRPPAQLSLVAVLATLWAGRMLRVRCSHRWRPQRHWGAAGEHHVLAQCAPPVSIFAKYLKPVFPLNITLQESTSIAAGMVV